MNGRLRAMLRLFAVQGTWNYERMLGVGMGYAAEPLLEDLKAVDPVRHGEAVVRSTEFFNCNPNLAGLALGATAGIEAPSAKPAAGPTRSMARGSQEVPMAAPTRIPVSMPVRSDQ
jgi:mannose/fructose/N-acetylgalactosamine-specific phosphotransferase system component IID